MLSTSCGLEGYQILTLTLKFMFPDESFDINPFHPLSYQTFRNEVLLPEAATLLIQHDLPHLNHKAAINTMWASQKLGTLLHPGVDSPFVDVLIEKVKDLKHRIEGHLMAKIEDEEVEVAGTIYGDYEEII